MSGRRRRTQGWAPPVAPAVELEDRERDLDLTTRQPAVAEEDEAEESEPEEPEALRAGYVDQGPATVAAGWQPEGAGEALRHRASAAMALSPPAVPCRACWSHGRDAAVRTALSGGLEAARAILPTGSALHWRDCWTQGRDAAVAALEGQ
jgi:hypothetical protein